MTAKGCSHVMASSGQDDGSLPLKPVAKKPGSSTRSRSAARPLGARPLSESGLPTPSGKRGPGRPRSSGSKRVAYYICSHHGCQHVVPIDLGERLMHRHEARFKEHAEHFAQHSETCLRCKSLVEAGEWSATGGGRDDFMCRHLGCGYYSSSPRPANRKQAVERHEKAFPIHYHHFDTCRGQCDLCKNLLDSGTWQADAGEAWRTRDNNQVKARLTTKEQQNTETPTLASLRGRDDVILIRVKPKKPKVSKAAAARAAAAAASAAEKAGGPSKTKHGSASRSKSKSISHSKSSSTSPPPTTFIKPSARKAKPSSRGKSKASQLASGLTVGRAKSDSSAAVAALRLLALNAPSTGRTASSRSPPEGEDGENPSLRRRASALPALEVASGGAGRTEAKGRDADPAPSPLLSLPLRRKIVRAPNPPPLETMETLDSFSFSGDGDSVASPSEAESMADTLEAAALSGGSSGLDLDGLASPPGMAVKRSRKRGLDIELPPTSSPPTGSRPSSRPGSSLSSTGSTGGPPSKKRRPLVSPDLPSLSSAPALVRDEPGGLEAAPMRLELKRTPPVVLASSNEVAQLTRVMSLSRPDLLNVVNAHAAGYAADIMAGSSSQTPPTVRASPSGFHSLSAKRSSASPSLAAMRLSVGSESSAGQAAATLGRSPGTAATIPSSSPFKELASSRSSPSTPSRAPPSLSQR
ncbi:uncharacterized protein AMSG_07445 [Thecamonas trahens ATCC 50062]|uniref:Uncharacterized protein n=1 Tax=Thecamonas trahens ATCC 50062 TaxID=461836 RepID=A0A0L0DH54_THETB|nr:hypothetical protein AMSG_07445 [Thecamonas trahens ATCC 50062]KNC51545.1 hypothetical protein AMSG_07445 [Thecamonas trahens ATCC 50062]|eukprot:XP_013755947.1 hypothetical protein AMSG_07445 [Thecamonas trahens ATCC 50062]